MTTPPPIAPAPEMPRQTSEEIPAAPAPKQEETPAEDQNTADPVDGEFKKVDEEIIPGEYRRVEEPPRPEHEQMTSSYTYGGQKKNRKQMTNHLQKNKGYQTSMVHILHHGGFYEDKHQN